MNGATLALKTARAAGVDVCFANPGTTEMEWVSALDSVPDLRGVLCLFEGVATGAADGFARIAGRPALTLLHLGPGFANGIANLHNARRAGSPVVNLIGDHATWHLDADAPLSSDIESLAAPVSRFVRRTRTAADCARGVAEAIAASQGPPAGVATVIVPQDAAWEESETLDVPQVTRAATAVDADAIDAAARCLREKGARAGLLLGSFLSRASLEAAASIRAATGCRVWVDTFPGRLAQGAGIPAFDAVPYFPEQAIEALASLEALVTAGARPPVAFFGYRTVGRSDVLPEACARSSIAELHSDPEPALCALREATGGAPVVLPPAEPVADVADGPLDFLSLGAVLAAWQPEGAILVNEAATSGLGFTLHAANAAPHDVLHLTGGAIGQGLPGAVGAAIAAPDRRVVAFQADGSGMYTLQSLWTMAREQLDVTIVVCANRAYRILQMELGRTGNADPGPVARSLTDLEHPELQWTRLAEGMGVPARRVTTTTELRDALDASRGPGPVLIEAIL